MNWVQRMVARAFRLGETAISASDADYGYSPETYSPSRYGDYMAINAAVFAAVNLRARNLAKLPMRIYRHAPGGERAEITSGRLYDLFRRVNPHWTFRRLIRMTEAALCSYGQAFWVLENGRPGRSVTQVPPVEIWWAHPSKMRVIPDAKDYIKGFTYEDVNGDITFSKDEVIWFKYDNPQNEYSGLSPIAAARLAIETAQGALRSNRQIFDAGMQIAGIVHPADKSQSLTRDQAEQLSAMLDKRFRGADKAHRVAVLSQPVAFESLTITPKDAEFLELLKWGMREVAMVYGVPPELIGDHEHATYSNISSSEKALWWDTLIPEASMIADEITERLIPLFGNEADEVVFDTSDIDTLQEDRSVIINQMHSLFQMGVPLNRLLQELAPRFLPPDRKGYTWGDVAWLPGNLIPVGSGTPAVDQPTVPASGSAEVAPSVAVSQLPSAADLAAAETSRNKPSASSAEAVVTEETPTQRALKLLQNISLRGMATVPIVTRGVVEDFARNGIRHETYWRSWNERVTTHEVAMQEIMRDYFARQQASVLTKIRNQTVDADFVPFTMAEWNKRLRAVFAPVLAKAYRDGGEATLDSLSEATRVIMDDTSVPAVRWMESRIQQLVRAVNEETTRDLRTIFRDAPQDDVPSRIRATFQVAMKARSSQIARIEAVAAVNAGGSEGARQSGIVRRKRWVSAYGADDHARAHNAMVLLNQSFFVDGATGPCPGSLEDPRQNLDCRCTVLYEMD